MTGQVTQALETTPPFTPIGAGIGPLVCSRCGTTNDAAAERCASCQVWLPGNQAARTLGLSARHQPEAILRAADAFHAGVLSDKGGQSEMSTLELAIAEQLRTVYVLASVARDVFVEEGMRTRLGRDAFDRFLAALDRFDRLAQRLGVKRFARRVGPMEALARRPEVAS